MPKRQRVARLSPSTPASQEASTSGREEQQTHVDCLPDELLLKVLAELARIGPVSACGEDAVARPMYPFRTLDHPGEPHPGLRSYPFLGQVCRRWRRVLEDTSSMSQLHRDVCIDFGHELITAVHTPIAWSDRRPSDDEFRESFAATKLSAARVLAFVRRRRHVIRRLVLMNSEGYWSDEGDFVTLQSKHNFEMAHFGILLGMLQDSLEELRVQHCNDLLTSAGPPQSLTCNGAFSAVACVRSLRRLAIEDLQCRVQRDALAELGSLAELEELSITAEDQLSWAAGIDAVPDAWQQLQRLRRLELRGHSLLVALPGWLQQLPALRHLDVGHCRHLVLDGLAALTQLEVLSLQGLSLQESLASAAPAQQQPLPHAVARRPLPDLRGMASLTALNLADNFLTSVPVALGRLRRLRHLDLSGNLELKVTAPLSCLAGLPDLVGLDLRSVSMEESSQTYWSADKCATMNHISHLTKALRRRNPLVRVAIDLD